MNLRPARYDEADAKAYVRYLEQASDGLFRTMFGAQADAIMARVALQPGHEFSLEHVVLAELDGQVVGGCAGGATAPVPTKLLVREAGWRIIRAGAVFTAVLPTMSALGKRAPGDWYLQSIAVDPEARGHGVGSALFADAVQRARDAGADRLCLDVEVENHGAQKLYERLGMTRESTSPGWLPGIPRVHRMVMDVTADARHGGGEVP